jgi:adenylosuccinate lyase
MIRKFTEVVAQLHVDEERMRENIEDARGLVFSQRLLLELIKRGRTRKEAYEYVKALCEQSRRRGVHLKEILKEEGLHDILKLEDLFDLNYYRRWVNSIFNDIKE